MKTKTFDCVAMKHEIQQKLREQYGESTCEERNRRVRATMAQDAHLARLLSLVPGEKPAPHTGLRA